MRSNAERLVTSDYIYDELLTLFRSRGHTDRAKDWVAQIYQHRWHVIRVTQADLRKATEVFFEFADKNWSFTDCTSRVMMQRLSIQRAFAFDHHFHQFGTVTVVP
jgi:predicted nucleic acid-binding protein